ncbi:MAG: hypothetical protein KAS32_29270 [Candidatus Peribacteraceae bacterium]|nr:hypothetical protein [Candidatus Peribacteraceae bacterium]
MHDNEMCIEELYKFKELYTLTKDRLHSESFFPEACYLVEFLNRNLKAFSLFGTSTQNWKMLKNILYMEPNQLLFGEELTRRDMAIAATIFQWLGTSAGRDFINSAEERVGEIRQEKADVQSLINNLNIMNKEGGLPQHV